MTQIFEDDKLVAFKKAYDNGEYNLNTEKYIKELQSLHITRKVRLLNSEEIVKNISLLVEALTQNQSVRSRVVEIKMDCVRVAIKLNTKKESLINYILVKYREELKSIKGTQTDRNAYVQELFNFTTSTSSRVKVLQDFCDILLNDIDQASWCLKSVIDCMKILDEAKGIVN